RRGARGESVGLGIAAYMEINATGPLERATIAPAEDGTFVVRVAVSSVGQGLQTVLSQIAADELGIPLERVEVRHHDTDDLPEGIGTFASRSTVLAGNAIAVAAQNLRAQAEAAGLGLATDTAELAARGIRAEG